MTASILHPILVRVLVLSSVTACVTLPQPYRNLTATEVPDGSPVRFYPEPRAPAIRGRALDWALGTPRVITGGRDTVIVPVGTRRQMLIPEKRNHVIAGAVTGWAIAAVLSYAYCPPPKRYCGEEDPLPLIGTGLGALIGSRVKTEWWVTIR